MTSLTTDPPPAPAPDGSAPRLRIVYREHAGAIHFDWAADRLAEAIADPEGVVWVDIEDIAAHGNGQVTALFRDVFHFHPLAIDDALHETHVPKVDDWGDYLFLVVHLIDFAPETHRLRLHQLDAFLGRNFVVTYHVEPMPVIDEHRRNIQRDPINRLRHGADHLLYHLLDMVVAQYLPVIEHLDEAIDAAQDEVFKRPTQRTLKAIFQVKRSAIRLQRVLAPQREVLNRLARDEYEPIKFENRVYFRDVYDHLVRIHDINESLRDLIAGALDTYLSAISNRTNEIMKTLTIVTVMFLPMSFLTSFFGMNFFGEKLNFNVNWPKGFLFWSSCLIMAGTPVGMWIWAKRRRWF